MKAAEIQAGHELDALIAEKVMGWSFKKEDYANARGSGWLSISPEGSYEGFGDEKSGFPYYSTAIKDAWLVVEKIPYPVISFIGGLWKCEFVNREGNLDHMIADTAPLAICRAALKVIEDA